METIGELIEVNERHFPNAEALIFGDQRLTHRDLARRARLLATSLWKAGVRKQDRVALLATNCVEYFDFFGACELAGYIAASINFRLKPKELLWILRDSAPKVVIFEVAFAETIAAIRDDMDFVEQFVCIGSGCPSWAAPYEQLLASGHDDLQSRSRPDDFVYLVYTSGTTGRPKGAARRQLNACRYAELSAFASAIGRGSIFLIGTPMFHVGGKAYQLSTHWMGGKVVLHRAFDPAAVLHDIIEEQVSATFMVPRMLEDFLDVAAVDGRPVTSLQTLITASAPIPAPLLTRGLKALGPVFMVQYGSTETLATSMSQWELNPAHFDNALERTKSVGPPIPGVDLKIFDENDQPCAQGVTGEICVRRADFQIDSYWNNTAATAEAFRGGWFHTGDLGYFDETGYVFLVDRKKDMIISGGENVYSREVEAVLYEHPLVADAAVIGIPDAKWQEVVKAIIVPKHGQSISEASLIEHCRQALANYKCPRSITFIEAMPRLETGKIDKLSLRAQHGGTMAAGI